MDICYVERGLAHAGPIPPPLMLADGVQTFCFASHHQHRGMYVCGWLGKGLGSHSFCWLLPRTLLPRERPTSIYVRPSSRSNADFSTFLFFLPVQAPQTRPPTSSLVAPTADRSTGTFSDARPPPADCMLSSSAGKPPIAFRLGVGIACRRASLNLSPTSCLFIMVLTFFARVSSFPTMQMMPSPPVTRE